MIKLLQDVFLSKFDESSFSGTGKSYTKETKTPAPHQQEAIDAIINEIGISDGDLRTKCIMACGTGKTLVAQRVADVLAEKYLLAMPTLALISQTLKEYQEDQIKNNMQYIVICSDKTVAANSRNDEIRVDMEDFKNNIPENVQVLSNPSEIAKALRSEAGPVTIMSTFHSLDLVASAQRKKDVPKLDLFVIDEAHKTAGDENSFFALAHDSQKIKSYRRLYLTATPKIYTSGDNVISMDDKSVFGNTCYSLPFAKAVELNLLTDYRILIPVVSKKEVRAFTALDNYELSILALLKAAKEHQLSKIVTFHHTIKKAKAIAEFLATQKVGKRTVWAKLVSGKMDTKKRVEILQNLGGNKRDILSVVTNSRCLTEGIDVPNLDAVAFFDPRSSGVDIAQALGRAIRKSPNKKYGYFILPLVVTEGSDPEEIIEGSEFKKIIQVIRAISFFDDTFESKIRSLGSSANNEKVESPESWVFKFDGIEKPLLDKVKTKLIKVGLGIRETLLTEDMIIEAARKHYGEYGVLPTLSTKGNIPSLPNDTWSSLDSALHVRGRGIQVKTTLFKLLKPLREEFGIVTKEEKGDLELDLILDAAMRYYDQNKILPNKMTKEEIPGLPNETWSGINKALTDGNRGFSGGTSLFEELRPLREKLGLLNNYDKTNITISQVISAAREFYKLHKKLPTSVSQEKVPNMPDETWSGIRNALQKGNRGLKKTTWSKAFKSLRDELGIISREDKLELSVDGIIDSARIYYQKYGKLPRQANKEEVPNYPGETWNNVNAALFRGERGLPKSSLSQVLLPLKKELGLIREDISIDMVIESAREFYKLYGRLPHSSSPEPAPNLPLFKWTTINYALKEGKYGLSGGTTLSELMKELKKELD